MIPTHVIPPARRDGACTSTQFWSVQARDLETLDAAKRRDPANAGGTWTAREIELADALDDAYLECDLVGFGLGEFYLAEG